MEGQRAPAPLYHLVPVAQWRAACASGDAYVPSTFEQDGFVHLTSVPALLLSVANHFYKDVVGDYLVIELDPQRVAATEGLKVVFEAAMAVGDKPTRRFREGVDGERASEGEGGAEQAQEQEQREEQLFPHLYGGGISPELVVAELRVQRDDVTGAFLSIDFPHVPDATCLEPWEYLRKVPGKNVRGTLIRSFQQWLKVEEAPLLAIMEIIASLHNASLLIDDIEDGSTVRRGVPAAHMIYGVPSTINCANYVYFIALEKVHALGSSQACTGSPDACRGACGAGRGDPER